MYCRYTCTLYMYSVLVHVHVHVQKRLHSKLYCIIYYIVHVIQSIIPSMAQLHTLYITPSGANNYSHSWTHPHKASTQLTYTINILVAMADLSSLPPVPEGQSHHHLRRDNRSNQRQRTLPTLHESFLVPWELHVQCTCTCMCTCSVYMYMYMYNVAIHSNASSAHLVAGRALSLLASL